MRTDALAIILFLFGFLAAPATGQPPKEKPKDNPKDVPTKPAQELSRGSSFGGKNLDQWMQDLKSKDPSTQENAIQTLKLYGHVAQEAVPELLKLTGHRDVSIRVNTAIALGVIGFDQADAEAGVAALTRLLGDSQAIVRYQAARALGSIGPPAAASIPNLVLMARANEGSVQSWELRKAASYALGSVAVDRQLGPDARAVNTLAGATNDVSHQVRLEAILGLIVLGTPAKPADKLIVQRAAEARTKDPSKHVVIWAHMLLMRIDKVSDQHLAAIAKLLKSPEATVRSHVGRALGTVGPEAKSRISELVDALQDEQEPMPIYWIVWAMVQMGDPAPRAIKALEQLMSHREASVRNMAREALALLNGRTAPADPPMKK